MSDSYPTIQESLSELQKDFMGCVEMHLDPPEDRHPTYAVEALFRCAGDAELLPAEAVRFRVSIEEQDSDLSERCHSIEFVDRPDAPPRGWVRHRMKRVENMAGRYFWTESRFEVAAPGIPEGKALSTEVELEVRVFLDRIRALDRSRQLVEIAA